MVCIYWKILIFAGIGVYKGPKCNLHASIASLRYMIKVMPGVLPDTRPAPAPPTTDHLSPSQQQTINHQIIQDSELCQSSK
jgi:hypothetical protein